MKLLTTDLKSALSPVIGSTHTVHWATESDNHFWTLCSSGEAFAASPLTVKDGAEANCPNCLKVADSPTALLRRFAHEAQSEAEHRFDRK